TAASINQRSRVRGPVVRVGGRPDSDGLSDLKGLAAEHEIFLVERLGHQRALAHEQHVSGPTVKRPHILSLFLRRDKTRVRLIVGGRINRSDEDAAAPPDSRYARVQEMTAVRQDPWVAVGGFLTFGIK